MKKSSNFRTLHLFLGFFTFSSSTLCLGFAVPTNLKVRNDQKQDPNTLGMTPLNPVTVTDTFHTIASTYNACLDMNPILTKSITAFTLCSACDLIAQKRSSSETLNWGRSFRFALKGVGSSLIWNCWYEAADDVVLDALRPFRDMDKPLTAPVRIAMAMLLEQFIVSPIVFGSWDIPMSTLLNGADVQDIPSEVRSKLGGLLWSNAVVWSPANVILYSIPPIYRIGFSNIIDLFWQSILADVAADCGKKTKEEDITSQRRKMKADPVVL